MFDIKVPWNWKEVNKEEFVKRNIQSLDNVPCIFAYDRIVGNKTNIIMIYDYSFYGSNFFNDLDKDMKKIKNKTIKDKNTSADVVCLFNEFFTSKNYNAYVTICKVTIDKTIMYSFQIFNMLGDFIVGANTSVLNLDEKNIFDSAFENDCIKELVQVILNAKTIN